MRIAEIVILIKAGLDLSGPLGVIGIACSEGLPDFFQRLGVHRVLAGRIQFLHPARDLFTAAADMAEQTL